jgi:ABC-type multidrug transport system ATPase subunit
VEGLVARVGGFVLEAPRLSLEGPGVALVVGGNGAGKTTLLKAMLGLIRPLAGRVEMCGRDVTGRPEEAGRCASYMPQWSPHASPGYPVTGYELLEYSFRVRRLKFPRGEALEMLARLGLGDGVASRPLRSLTPGQRQKLFFARAMLLPTPVAVLDEPFSSVDRASAEAMAREVERQASRRLVVLTSHRADVGVEASVVVRVKGGRVAQA